MGPQPFGGQQHNHQAIGAGQVQQNAQAGMMLPLYTASGAQTSSSHNLMANSSMSGLQSVQGMAAAAAGAAQRAYMIPSTTMAWQTTPTFTMPSVPGYYVAGAGEGGLMPTQAIYASTPDMSSYLASQQGYANAAQAAMYYYPSTTSSSMSGYPMYAQQYMAPAASGVFRPAPTSSSLSSLRRSEQSQQDEDRRPRKSLSIQESVSSAHSGLSAPAKQVKKRRSRQKRKGVVPGSSPAAAAEAAGHRTGAENDDDDELDEAVRNECYGEKRMAITFKSYGVIGDMPQRMGNRNLFVPDGVKGTFSKYAEEWEFEVVHSHSSVLCEDGKKRVCVTWTMKHPASGEKIVSSESPREAMTREKLGRTICNKVFRDALEKRKVEYEKLLLEETSRPEPNDSKVSNLEALIETLGNHRFAQGPLVFGLYHRELQNAMARQWKRIQATSRKDDNSHPQGLRPSKIVSKETPTSPAHVSVAIASNLAGVASSSSSSSLNTSGSGEGTLLDRESARRAGRKEPRLSKRQVAKNGSEEEEEDNEDGETTSSGEEEASVESIKDDDNNEQEDDDDDDDDDNVVSARRHRSPPPFTSSSSLSKGATLRKSE